MKRHQKVEKDPIMEVEAEMQKLLQDLENIELMNQWGKEDAENARRELEEAKDKHAKSGGCRH